MVSWREHVELGSKIKVGESEIFYIDKGVGEAVLLLHGWASSSYSWRYNWPVLSRHFRVIAPDIPGFGLSQRLPTKLRLKPLAQILVDFLEKIGVEKFHLVGMSMGGAIASYLASEYAEKVEKLILINPAIFRVRVGARRVPIGLISIRPFYDIVSRLLVTKSFIRYALKKVYVKRSLLDEKLLDAYYQSIKLSGKTLIEAMSIMDDFDLSYIRNIKCPVLFVLGGRDRLVPWEFNKRISEEIGAKIFVDPESGHAIHEENPDAVNKAILDFLKS